jgi:aryl-alcohol dehydrogenase-like predicted oxidoreductase
MQYREFGRTGWQVSEIAFGGWQIGGQWGNVVDDESIDTLLYAFEKGINFVDTAELYGSGRSETVIGRALKEWKGDKIYVATKVQPIKWPDPDLADPNMKGRYPGWYLRENVDNSLKRLGVERLDLLQLHCWLTDGSRNLDWLETLNDLRLAGKVDKIGVSIRDYRPDEGVEISKLGLVDSVQVIFNLFEQRPVDHLFPAGAETKTAMIARVPLDSGALGGNWTKDTYSTWEPGSVQAHLFRGGRFDETMQRLDALKAECAPHYSNLAEAAMRYALSSPEVSTLIPGIKNRRHVDLNVSYSDGKEFPANLLAMVGAHNWPRPENFYR